jgi:hypothetical protein
VGWLLFDGPSPDTLLALMIGDDAEPLRSDGRIS